MRKGLRVAFTAPPAARLVRVKVFAAGSQRARTTMFVSLTKRIGGPTYSLARTPATASHDLATIVLPGKSIRRALGARGKFRIELTPGVSAKRLGAKTIRTIVIR